MSLVEHHILGYSLVTLVFSSRSLHAALSLCVFYFFLLFIGKKFNLVQEAFVYYFQHTFQHIL